MYLLLEKYFVRALDLILVLGDSCSIRFNPIPSIFTRDLLVGVKILYRTDVLSCLTSVRSKSSHLSFSLGASLSLQTCLVRENRKTLTAGKLTKLSTNFYVTVRYVPILHVITRNA